MSLVFWILGGAGVCWGLVWIVGRWSRPAEDDLGTVPLTTQRRQMLHDAKHRQQQDSGK